MSCIHVHTHVYVYVTRHNIIFCHTADSTDFLTHLGPDYMITFSSIATTRNFYFRTIEDDVLEGTECLYFSLEANDDFVFIHNDNGTLTVCIEEDDCKSFTKLLACTV